MKTVLLVMLGGAFGSGLRYALSLLAKKQNWQDFPLGTFYANILSCLIVVCSLWLISKNSSLQELRPLLIIGFCGGLSTFSTFSLETYDLLSKGSYLMAFLNVFLSLIMALLIIWIASRN